MRMRAFVLIAKKVTGEMLQVQFSNPSQKVIEHSRIVILGAILSVILAALGVPASTPAAAAPGLTQTDMKVLVISNGSTTPIEDMLTVEGVPFTPLTVAQANSNFGTGNGATNDAYLATPGTAPVAKFQAVVLPDAAGTGLNSAALTALNTYLTTYGIRQLSAYDYPNSLIGMNAPSYSGQMDGKIAQVTPGGLAATGPFKYLAGPVPFDDVDPAVANESYGYIATPLSGSAVEPLVTADSGVIVGIHRNAVRENMFLTFISNSGQTQMRLLGPGIIEWLTGGTHLGLSRNFLSVHADDILNADARWHSTRNCTPGEDCTIDDPLTPEVETQSMIMMTPADVTALLGWQTGRLKFDMAFNGYPSATSEFPGSAALTSSLLAVKTSLRWINHTYNHIYFGCQQLPDPPYNCTTQPVTSWVPTATILADIQSNISWALANGVPIDATELITGEHSGLADSNAGRVQPDNANFLAALNTVNATKPVTKVTASDASKELNARQAGPATTLPRYPNSLYYNVATQAELIDEYNWIYTSAANGGSGYCSLHPDVTTCITPLTFTSATNNGFLNYIAPFEARQTLSRVLNNDPRPHFVHQSNLSEERLALTWMGQVVDGAATFPYGYKDLVNVTTTPIVNPTMTQAALVLTQQASWKAAQGSVSAYIKGGQVIVTNNGTNAAWVPLSAATGTKAGDPTTLFGDGTNYMGTRSAWTELAAGASLTIDIAPNNLPTAAFTVDCSTDPVCTVTSNSTDTDGTILSSTWDFGDGTPAIVVGVQPPGTPVKAVHAFNENKGFTITLTVKDNRGGDSAPVTQEVTITKARQRPIAVIDVSCTDLTCTVSGSRSSDADGDAITKYEWDFGDNSPLQATDVTPVAHVYPAPSTYRISLVVTDSTDAPSTMATVDVTVTARVNKAPQAAFTATCANLTCGFNASASSDPDGSIIEYSWSFGDGTTGSGVNPLGHVFPGAGSYKVTLTVIDRDRASSATSQTVTVSAPVASAPTPVATAPTPIVKVKAVSGKGKLKVDVNPNLKGTKYWKFKVQYLKKDGVTWGQYKKSYKTYGKKETRTINFKKGTYRVMVLPKYGYGTGMSTTVVLKK